MTIRNMLAVGIGLIVSAGLASAQQPVAVPVNYVPNAPAAGGCNSCGTSASHAATAAKLHSAFFIGKGTEMPIGCSCFAANRTFAFGSCNQFFNPAKDCARCGVGRGNCHNPVGGTGPAAAVPPCTYGSYHNR